MKNKKLIFIFLILTIFLTFSLCAFANGDIDVSDAVEETWLKAREQIVKIVDNVIFPIIDTILGILFFVKLTLAYIDYRKHGQFEWTAPAILLVSLIFSLTCPMYIWKII